MNSFAWPKMDQAILETLDFAIDTQSLDALLESFLRKLLQVDHIRRVEISLYNKANDLVSIATATRPASGVDRGHEIRVQSWVMESSVRH
jgi:hypothetical protein